MAVGEQQDEGQGLYAHQLRALLARKRQEELELIGASSRSLKVIIQGLDRLPQQSSAGTPRVRSTFLDIPFHIPSPLTGRDRQQWDFRIPHCDIQPHVRQHVPRNKVGATHPGYRARHQDAGGHVDYVLDGAVVRYDTHLDYIWRGASQEDRQSGMLMDALDERDLREQKNEFATWTNIDGGRDRQRGLFEAAARSENKPRVHYLVADEEALTAIAYLARGPNAPEGLERGMARLRAAAARSKKREIEVASGSQEEIYEMLCWIDREIGDHKKLVRFKQGRTGRSHYRFVFELPEGADRSVHYAILKEMGQSLAADGWMVVGAIHEPDPHGDRRNPHIHIDAYDRPSRWLDQKRCWDFEYEERRNGKTVRPYRQNKVRYTGGVDGRGKPRKVDTAQLIRDRYIGIVNQVVVAHPEIHPFVTGTYADHGIELTPLKHMGNRSIALEKRGEATADGTINARRILQDDLNACNRRAEEKRAALVGDVTSLFACAADETGIENVRHGERLFAEAINRELELELADVVVAASRSRADAILRNQLDTDRHHRRERPRNTALIAAAKADIDWVRDHSPDEDARRDEQRKIDCLYSLARNAFRDINQGLSQCGSEVGYRVRYIARSGSVRSRIPVRNEHRVLERDRLLMWLKLHGHKAQQLINKNLTIELGPNVPKSIDTLMQKYSGDEEVQKKLLAEIARRVRVARAEQLHPTFDRYRRPTAKREVAVERMSPSDREIQHAQEKVAVMTRGVSGLVDHTTALPPAVMPPASAIVTDPKSDSIFREIAVAPPPDAASVEREHEKPDRKATRSMLALVGSMRFDAPAWTSGGASIVSAPTIYGGPTIARLHRARFLTVGSMSIPNGPTTLADVVDRARLIGAGMHLDLWNGDQSATRASEAKPETLTEPLLPRSLQKPLTIQGGFVGSRSEQASNATVPNVAGARGIEIPEQSKLGDASLHRVNPEPNVHERAPIKAVEKRADLDAENAEDPTTPVKILWNTSARSPTDHAWSEDQNSTQGNRFRKMRKFLPGLRDKQRSENGQIAPRSIQVTPTIEPPPLQPASKSAVMSRDDAIAALIAAIQTDPNVRVVRGQNGLELDVTNTPQFSLTAPIFAEEPTVVTAIVERFKAPWLDTHETEREASLTTLRTDLRSAATRPVWLNNKKWQIDEFFFSDHRSLIEKWSDYDQIEIILMRENERWNKIEEKRQLAELTASGQRQNRSSPSRTKEGASRIVSSAKGPEAADDIPLFPPKKSAER